MLRKVQESGKWPTKSYAAEAVDRAINKRADKWICIDSRKSDKRAGRENDLDRDFVRELLKDGCAYCGEAEIRLTLDRINNDLGHIKTNVVPSCVRCNSTRGDMPYKAWLMIAPAMRVARESGVFGTWVSRWGGKWSQTMRRKR